MNIGLTGMLIVNGYRPYAYSGRGMMGKQCVAINVESLDEIWRLAIAIGGTLGDEANISAPKTDSMGHGYVVYWPSYIWVD